MAAERSAELVRLMSAFEQSEQTKNLARESVVFLQEIRREVAANYHLKLCSAMLKAINGGAKEYAELLRCCGPVKTLTVIHSSIGRVA